MKKFYFRLHTLNSNFKKHFLRLSLSVFLILLIGTNAIAQCDVNPVANQVVCNNAATTAINFTGTATTFNWTNNTPSIGLAVSGAGNIASFTALNPSATAITATIIVTPSSGACTGTAINFTITVNPSPFVNLTPTISCGGVAGVGGPCNPLTVSGNADSYIWSPLLGLYSNCTATAPYTGGSTTAVFAAPASYTVYTVTGTNAGTGCTKAATTLVNYTPPPPVVTPNPAIMCLGDPAIKLKVLSAPNTAQFCSGPVNIPVPDNNPAGASNNIAVVGLPANSIITGITVTINMSHTRIGNMVFVLKAPNGQILNLDYHLTATGGTGPTAGFVNTMISSTGTAALIAGANPYTGIFRADAQGTPAGGFGAPGPTGMQPTVTNWASLAPNGTSVNGNWTLGFYDGVTGDVGILTSWCIGINYTTGGIPASPAVWSPAAGLFMDPAAVIPYIAGTQRDSVWARPTPAGVYPYQVTVQSLPVSPLSFTNPAPITIPVGSVASPYPVNLTVSGLPSTGVTIKSIVLNGINHSRSQDVDILLQSPSGQNMILMSDVGGANAVNAIYTFMDSGPAMSATAANQSGTYKPTNSIGTNEPDTWPAPGPGSVSQTSPAISNFVGIMNGTWKLFVFDDDGTADQGVISGGFTINFDIGVPACTSPPRIVTVRVVNPVTIISHPANQALCPGSVFAMFSVTIAGSGPNSYQWQLSPDAGTTWYNIGAASPYSGSNTATLTVNPVPLTMNGYLFRVLMNGGSGCSGATSNAALLRFNPIPTVAITANPLIIGPTQSTTISSTVTPNPATTFTWYYNNSVLPGETSANLLVNYGSPGEYQLRVTDIYNCGVGVSNILTITNSFALNVYTYPNPSIGIFQVRYPSDVNIPAQRTLSVFNNMGDRIMTKTFTQTIPYQKIDIDIRAHGKGLYWIELRDAAGKRLAVNRVVVQ